MTTTADLTGATANPLGRPAGHVLGRLTRGAVIVALAAALGTSLAPGAVAESRSEARWNVQSTSASEPPEHDMEGMNMPAEEVPGATESHSGDVSRPRGPVLGTFAAVNAAVLLSAALVRRRTKPRLNRRRASPPGAPATA